MPARARKVWTDPELLLRAANVRFRAWEKNTRELRLAADALRDRGEDDRADFLQAVAGIADRVDGLGGGAGFGTCQAGRREVRVWWVIRARKGRPAERRCLWVCWVVAGTGGRDWRLVHATPGGRVCRRWPMGVYWRVYDLRAWLRDPTASWWDLTVVSGPAGPLLPAAPAGG